MIQQIAGEAPCTVVADNAYDTHGFVAQLCQINTTQHIDRTRGGDMRWLSKTPPAADPPQWEEPESQA